MAEELIVDKIVKENNNYSNRNQVPFETWLAEFKSEYGGKVSFGVTFSDMTPPPDEEIAYINSKIGSWWGTEAKTRELVEHIMDDSPALYTKADRTQNDINFIRWVLDHEQAFPKYQELNKKMVVERYIHKEAMEKAAPFLSASQAPLPIEASAFGVTTPQTYAEFSVLKFSEGVLKFLKGGTRKTKIFVDQGVANKKVWELGAYDGDWTGIASSDQRGYRSGQYRDGPKMENLLIDLYQIDQAQMGKYYSHWQDALTSTWAGKWKGANEEPTFWGDTVLKKFFGETLGLNIEGWTYDQRDMNDFKFKPVYWYSITQGQGAVFDFAPDYIKAFMPMKIEDGGGTIIDNSDGDKITGFWGDDTEATTGTEKTLAEAGELWKVFEQKSKTPSARLQKEYFKGFNTPFPKGLGSENPNDNVGLEFTVDTDILRLIPEAKSPVKGVGKPAVFKGQFSDGDDISEMAFDDELFKRFYIGFYFTFLYYYADPLNRVSADNSSQYKETDIFDYCCYKTAQWLNRLWTQYAHDTKMANFYALILLLNAAEVDLNKIDEEAAKELLKDVEDAADDAMGNAADDTESLQTEIPNKEQREKFYKQCSLMLNMHKLANSHQLRINGDKGQHKFHKNNAEYGTYNNRIHSVIAGGSTALGRPTRQTNNFINRLMTPAWGSIRPFFDMENHELAALVPRIRLWKVYVKDGKLTECEFEFPTVPGTMPGSRGPSGLLRDVFDRGDGIGLKEFSWVMDGETPATANKFIKGDLSLFFQTFTDFTALRVNKSGQKYRFVDLFASPSCLGKRRGNLEYPHALQYDPEYYRIKIEVGWGSPAGASAALKNALEHNRQQYSLVLVDHEININEDGTVDITANYRAYIEEVMDSSKFNALSSPDIDDEKSLWKAEWDKAIGDVNGFPKCSERDLSLLRTRINERLLTLTSVQHRNIMKQLLKYRRIYYADFDEAAVESFRTKGIFNGIPKISNSSNRLGSSPTAKENFEDWLARQEGKPAKSFEKPANIEGDYRAYYFFLGDLIYVITSNLFNGGVDSNSTENIQGAENTRFLLTDFQYYNPLLQEDQSVRVLNIADIPISVDFFFKWYNENIIRPGVPAMPIGTFIKKILIELISEAMAEVCINNRGDFHTTFSVGSATAGGKKLDGRVVDPVQYMMANQQGSKMRLDISEAYDPTCEGACLDKLPLRPVAEEGGVENQFNYVIVYSAFRNPHHPGKGDRGEDHTNGCYHLDIGRPKGIVKKVSFSKNNIKYHRESRMLNQGAAGLSMLSAVYDCKVDMIGNLLFRPGMEFWLNPYGFGGEAFGMPQHKPFGSAADAGEVEQRNQEIEDAYASDSSISPTEFQVLEDKQKEYERTGLWADSASDLTKIKRKPDRPKPKDIEECGISSYANVMGIGGYQLVTKVESKIAPGEFSTSVHAKHVFTGYAQETDYKKLYEQTEGKISDPNADVSPDGANCPTTINQLDIMRRTGKGPYE